MLLRKIKNTLRNITKPEFLEFAELIGQTKFQSYTADAPLEGGKGGDFTLEQTERAGNLIPF